MYCIIVSLYHSIQLLITSFPFSLLPKGCVNKMFSCLLCEGDINQVLCSSDKWHGLLKVFTYICIGVKHPSGNFILFRNASQNRDHMVCYLWQVINNKPDITSSSSFTSTAAKRNTDILALLWDTLVDLDFILLHCKTRGKVSFELFQGVQKNGGRVRAETWEESLPQGHWMVHFPKSVTHHKTQQTLTCGLIRESSVSRKSTCPLPLFRERKRAVHILTN